jgi:hypothetical protein
LLLVDFLLQLQASGCTEINAHWTVSPSCIHIPLILELRVRCGSDIPTCKDVFSVAKTAYLAHDPVPDAESEFDNEAASRPKAAGVSAIVPDAIVVPDAIDERKAEADGRAEFVRRLHHRGAFEWPGPRRKTLAITVLDVTSIRVDNVDAVIFMHSGNAVCLSNLNASSGTALSIARDLTKLRKGAKDQLQTEETQSEDDSVYAEPPPQSYMNRQNFFSAFAGSNAPPSAVATLVVPTGPCDSPEAATAYAPPSLPRPAAASVGSTIAAAVSSAGIGLSTVLASSRAAVGRAFQWLWSPAPISTECIRESSACETCAAATVDTGVAASEQTSSPAMSSGIQSNCTACDSQVFAPSIAPQPPPLLRKRPRDAEASRASACCEKHECLDCIHTSSPAIGLPGVPRAGVCSVVLEGQQQGDETTRIRGLVHPADMLVPDLPPCKCENGHHKPTFIERRSDDECYHTCGCGASWNRTPVPLSHKTTLFTEGEPHVLQMYVLRCSRSAAGCPGVLPYDGLGQGIFVHSARICIHESMLIGAMIQLYQGSTFDAIVTQWQAKYRYHNTKVRYELLPQRWLLRLLLRGYLQLIPNADVVCPCCGLHPDTLIADGTSLGCKMHLARKHLRCDHREKVASVRVCGAPSSSFIFMTDATGVKSMRLLLLRFISPPPLRDGRPSPGGSVPTAASGGITLTELGLLIDWCRNSKGKSPVVKKRLSVLGGVLQSLKDSNVTVSVEGGKVACPMPLSYILYPLIVQSPCWVCYEPAEQCAVLELLKIPGAVGCSATADQLRERVVLCAPFILDMLDTAGLDSLPEVRAAVQ